MAWEEAERAADFAAGWGVTRRTRPGGRRGAALALLSMWALALFGGAGGCTPSTEREPDAPVPGRIAFWRVSSDDAGSQPTAYVLASVAVHATTRLRFDATIEEAFAGASRVALPDDSALEPQNAIVGWRAHLDEGDSLLKWLGPSLHADYTEAIGRGGFPPGTAEVTAPWFAAGVVTGADFRRFDFVTPDEITAWFAHRAPPPATGIELHPLEPSATTYDRFGALSPELQIGLLRLALARSAHAGERLPAIQAAWQRGDVAELEELFAADLEGDPALIAAHRATVGAAAERLADALVRSLHADDAPASTFWILPAEVLVDEGGVLARLERSGFTVEQCVSRDGGGTLRPPAPRQVPALPPVETADAARRRVLLIGIDGASLRVIEPLLERGRLPALASLAAAGASGPLRSHRPIYSPRIWGSIATGKTPEHHGIEGFTFRDAAGNQQLYLSRHRKVHAIWNIFSDAGLDVGVVNWWNTYPPEIVRGVMISDHAMSTRLADLETVAGEPLRTGTAGGTVYPVEWLDRVEAAARKGAALTPIEDPFAGVVGIPPFMHREWLSKRYDDDAAVTRMALDVDRTIAPDLLMVFLPGIDRVSHHLWGALEPSERYGPNLRLSESQRSVVRDALEAYYEYTDALIGLLLARFDDDDLVLVMSDHGFEGGEHLGELTGVHEGEAALDGVLFTRGPGIAAGTSTLGTSVNDITPTVLAWRGLPLASDFDGRVGPFLAPTVPQPARVATHDRGPIERLEAGTSGNEEEILEQLRGLGYIE